MSSQVEQFGKYILLEKLASGGMAEVYLSKSNGAVGVNKFVAIKRILPQYSDNQEFIEMFKEEAKITVNLNHGNVVSIYDFGMERQQFFLVMEYVEGRNLRQILTEMKRTNTQFTVEQIVYMIKEVAAGLDHAHRCIDGTTGRPLNITHRDMSPQNIMVSFEGEVKIIDFGIAKAETQLEATKAGTLKGKFGYMSPEQADGQGIDLRTDVFSLGIVMWELLANDRLFTSSSEAAILRKIRECQVPGIRKINPSVPPELERIVNKALAKDKSLRYQTAAALHRDLNRFLNTEYPEFSPHDFSVFMKNAFSQAFLDQRKRLVEYAKIKHEDVNLDRTVVTQTDHRPSQAAAPSQQQSSQQQQKQRQPVPQAHGFDDEPDKLDIDIQTATDIKVNLDNLKTNVGPGPRRETIRTGTNLTGTHSAGSRTNAKIHQTGPYTLPPRNFGPDPMTTWAVRGLITAILVVGGWMVYKNVDMNAMTSKYLGASSAVSSRETAGQTEMATTAQFAVTVESQPPGAKIFLDGVDTGSYTPNRRSVIGNKDFAITLKKEGYLNYESVARADNNAYSVKATLQPAPRAAYIGIIVSNAGANPVLEVNGQRLHEKLPIDRYTIPAGVPVKIHAHNPFTGATDEQTINLQENEKRNIELILK
jgi:serine/threonine protein kinase